MSETVETGPVLSEEALADAVDRIVGPLRQSPVVLDYDDMAALVRPVLAALVAVAEQRGAAKEREACAVVVAKIDAREWGQHYQFAGQALARATDEIMRRGSR